MASQVPIQESYSSPLVNYIDPFKINGVEYTRFYTEINTELSVGDYVYILNGNYDNTTIINQNEYQYGSTGYKILDIDKNSIVLDIPYRTELPFSEDSFSDYTKVYVVDDLNKFNYENTDNGFGLELFSGEKYSTLNNNIFISQIDNMPYTDETQTNGKFFKSNLIESTSQVTLTNTRGILFDDSTILGRDLEEKDLYGLSNGQSGDTFIRFGLDKKFIKDFDFIKSNNQDKIIALSSRSATHSSSLWTWNKKTMEVTDDVMLDITSNEVVDARFLKSFGSGYNNLFTDKDNIELKLPYNLNGTFSNYKFNSNTSTVDKISYSASAGSNRITYQSTGNSTTIILGHTDPYQNINNRSFSFYSSIERKKIPSVENGYDLNGTNLKYGSTSSNGTIDPYFTLNHNDSYTYSNYFPVGEDGLSNVIPDKSRFKSVGLPTNVEIAEWINNDDGSQNIEYAFVGQGNNEENNSIESKGGLYIYSYSGNHVDFSGGSNTLNQTNLLNGTAGDWYIGNSFRLTNEDFQNYLNDEIFNVFNNIPQNNLSTFMEDIRDIKWVGTEKRDFGLGISTTNNGSVVVSSSNGIWYSKYLLTGYKHKYYIYVNFNCQLLINNEDFYKNSVDYDGPQSDFRIEYINENENISTIIAQNRKQDSDIYPSILDSEYVLASLRKGSYELFKINSPQFNQTFNNTIVSSIEYFDGKWLVGSGQYSPRVSLPDPQSPPNSSEGIYIYDTNINSSHSQNITTSFNFDIGDNLPSNNVMKVKGELINGKSRVWAATDQGLFMFDNDLSYNIGEYYYKIDFDNNNIPLDDNLYKNNKIYIMEDFEYDGISYSKGDICKWIKEDRRWEIDVNYIKPYLSKSHFSKGTFKDNSVFNDGIFGNGTDSNLWNGSIWRNGIFYNSIWKTGNLLSKSDKLIKQSYYSILKNDKVNLTTDFTNNNSFGYNLFIKSNVEKSNVENSNFINCEIGLENKDISLLDFKYSGSEDFNYSEIDIVKSYFKDSKIYSSIIKNSKIDSSDIISSNITDGSKIINSGSYDSFVDDADIENKGSIKVKGYDKWFNIKSDETGSEIIHVHKLFIDEKDFYKLNYGDSVYLNNFKIDNNDPTNILNSVFHLLGGSDGFYENFYENLNKIKKSNNNVEYLGNEYKVFLSKRTSNQNKFKSVVSFNGTDLDLLKVDSKLKRYSIDISIVVDKIPHGSASERYLNSTINDGVTKFNIIDTSTASIQKKTFEQTWINGGQWTSGSLISHMQSSNKFNYGLMVVKDINSTKMIKMDIYDGSFEIKFKDLYKVGDNIFMDNLWNTSFTEYVGGSFKIHNIVNTISESYVILNPYDIITNINSEELLTQSTSQYKFISSNRIDGENNNLRIKSGFFKNQSFNNLIIGSDIISENSDKKLTSNNDEEMLIINSDISNLNNLDIKNGIFINGHISNDFSDELIDINITSFKQVLNNVNFNGGYISKSSFLSGNFNDGIFDDNKYNDDNDLLPINNTTYNTIKTAVLPVWMDGSFNKGEFKQSVWMYGDFNDGKFYESEFLGGYWYNGKFGDKSTKSILNAFRKGTWNNGVFENGVFGDNINRIPSINDIYSSPSYIKSNLIYSKSGTNIWNDGNFNDGIFTTIDGNISIWNNGNFNNGQILDSVIWNDGIFNNGKFKSVYGRYVANIAGETDLLSISLESDIDGSRVVNLVDHYNTTLNYLNKYNISTLRDVQGDNDFNNPGTLILDTSDNQIKYSFLSESYNQLLSDPFSEIYSAHGYGELALRDFYNNPGNLGIQFKSIDYEINSNKNPLYNSNVIGSNIKIQNTSNEYVYDGSSYVDKTTFLSTNIGDTPFTYNNIYAWRNGVFNSGEFGDPNNFENANPSWLDGTFNGGKFYGKIWKNGTFIRGSFNGSGISQSQEDLNNIYEGFNAQLTIENYIDDFSNNIIATFSVEQESYKTTLDKYKWFGLWLDGDVLPNINEVSLANERVTENTLVEYFKRDKFKRVRENYSNFNKMIWVNGNFNNTNATFNESVWLSGFFNNGDFKNSLFNPYVERWDFEKMNFNERCFTFELDNEKCAWNNGIFNNGVFYYSDWNNGTFEYGTMVGGKFNKGIANYISGFSSIWENGRFRNGNWYGSNFTIDNVYGNDSTPNPFGYLGNYFVDIEYSPFITDILSNNASRIQDDRLHIWNIVDGTQSIFDYDLDGHYLGVDTNRIIIPSSTNSGGKPTVSGNTKSGNSNSKTALPQQSFEYIDFDMEDVSQSLSSGLMEFEFEVDYRVDTNESYDFEMNLTDIERLDSGGYNISFYTNEINKKWIKFPKLTSNELTLSADVYVDGILDTQDIIITSFNTINGLQNISFQIPANTEYLLKLIFRGDKVYNTSISSKESNDSTSNQKSSTIGTTTPTPTPNQQNSFTDSMYLQYKKINSIVSYTDNNNTLNGYIEPIYSGEYLNSDIVTVSGTFSYNGSVKDNNTLSYCGYDIATISIPTSIKSSDGAYAQYGNGSFMEGIWENGVWNNGYRGTEFGTTIEIEDLGLLPSDLGVFTYSNGSTASVYVNKFYNDTQVFQYRTSPMIYFNKVQRSFKVSKNKWRFVLESAFNIGSSNNNNVISNYNKLSIGDQVSVGNIIAIDINGNRKLIKELFTVVDIPTNNFSTLSESESTFTDSNNSTNSNKVTLEYEETFPIDDIQIDSDRHLIYAQKNVWLSGAFLNGYFEGIMTNGYIKGNRDITKLINSHLVDIKFEGGRLLGYKYDLSKAFDSKVNTAFSLSSQFRSKYNNKYHTTVVQNMEFIDDVTIQKFNMVGGRNVSINGNSTTMEKEITFSSTFDSDAIQYIYNSDIDVVYEPEFFSSLYDANIFNNCVLNESKIGTIINTKMNNVPAGYITYDILSSDSKFKYNTQPDKIDIKDFNLSLGSKYRKFNNIFDKSFEENPNSNFDTDLPSTFNVLESSKYGITKKNFGINGNGVSFGNNGNTSFEAINTSTASTVSTNGDSVELHEGFMYIFATASNDPTKSNNGSLIVGERNFKTRGRYHIVEVDVEFVDNKIIINPYDTDNEFTLNTEYEYNPTNGSTASSIPKLTIGQNYNELYENTSTGVKQRRGNLSLYDNDFIPYFDGRKLSEVNGFTQSNRLTIKTFIYNNFGGHRDNVKIFEKDFKYDTGSTQSNATIHSPIYYSFKHYEIDQIPFFRYQDFTDPLTGTVSNWNMLHENGANQHLTRKVDDRVKVPFHATSVPIDYDDNNLILSDNINFLGGTNIDNNNIIDLSIFNIINNNDTIGFINAK